METSQSYSNSASGPGNGNYYNSNPYEAWSSIYQSTVTTPSCHYPHPPTIYSAVTPGSQEYGPGRETDADCSTCDSGHGFYYNYNHNPQLTYNNSNNNVLSSYAGIPDSPNSSFGETCNSNNPIVSMAELSGHGIQLSSVSGGSTSDSSFDDHDHEQQLFMFEDPEDLTSGKIYIYYSKLKT